MLPSSAHPRDARPQVIGKAKAGRLRSRPSPRGKSTLRSEVVLRLVHFPQIESGDAVKSPECSYCVSFSIPQKAYLAKGVLILSIDVTNPPNGGVNNCDLADLKTSCS